MDGERMSDVSSKTAGLWEIAARSIEDERTTGL